MPEEHDSVRLIDLVGNFVHLEELMLGPGDDRAALAHGKRNFVVDLPIAPVCKEPQLVLNDLAPDVPALVPSREELGYSDHALLFQRVVDVAAFEMVVRIGELAHAVIGQRIRSAGVGIGSENRGDADDRDRPSAADHQRNPEERGETKADIGAGEHRI